MIYEFIGSFVALFIILSYGAYIQHKAVTPSRKLKADLVKQSAAVVDKMKKSSGEYPPVVSRGDPKPTSGVLR